MQIGQQLGISKERVRQIEDRHVDGSSDVVGVADPLRSSGRFVRDRSQGRSAQVSLASKSSLQSLTAAAGSSSEGLASRERKTGSEK